MLLNEIRQGANAPPGLCIHEHCQIPSKNEGLKQAYPYTGVQWQTYTALKIGDLHTDMVAAPGTQSVGDCSQPLL